MSRSRETSLDGLHVFAAVAETGGFTSAARRLGTTKASVSLQVRHLESQLGAALFARTTRQVRLTDAGRRLYDDSARALRVLRDALTRGRDGDAVLSGKLRLGAPIDYFNQSIARAVVEFAAVHLRLDVDIHTSDRVEDLVATGIDVAIRLGTLKDSSLRAAKLGEFEQWVVAAPSYFEKIRPPTHPRDLIDHRWIALTLMKTPLTWSFTSKSGRRRHVRVHSRMRIDSSASLRALLVAGAGISVLDEYSTRSDVDQGRLRRVLPSWTLPKGGVYAVFPPGRHITPSARAFVDFYRSFLSRR